MILIPKVSCPLSGLDLICITARMYVHVYLIWMYLLGHR
jgi:hypothetical protein